VWTKCVHNASTTPPALVDREHRASGRPSVRCLSCVHCLLTNTCCAWCSLSLLNGGISTKLARSVVHHVSWHCWEAFQGQQLKIEVIAMPLNLSPTLMSVTIRVLTHCNCSDASCMWVEWKTEHSELKIRWSWCMRTGHSVLYNSTFYSDND